MIYLIAKKTQSLTNNKKALQISEPQTELRRCIYSHNVGTGMVAMEMAMFLGESITGLWSLILLQSQLVTMTNMRDLCKQ